MAVRTAILGFPRIGEKRELKKAVEDFWEDSTRYVELYETAKNLRRRHWELLKKAEIDHIPGNDFSLYDHMLDMAVMFGVIPRRYRKISDPLQRYFAMARGFQNKRLDLDIVPLGMTKWFDTNYHYIVPEIASNQVFTLDASKILMELAEARALGIALRPVIVGPVSFLLLSRMSSKTAGHTLRYLPKLLDLYEELFAILKDRNVEWVQLDEPCLGMDLNLREKAAYLSAMERMVGFQNRPRLMLTTYFGAVKNNLRLAMVPGLDGLHIDLIRGEEDLEAALAMLEPSASLSLGVVDGRNVWRADLDADHALIARVVKTIGAERVIVATSCSLLHVPMNLRCESALDDDLRKWLAFAEEKLLEVRILADAAEETTPWNNQFYLSREAHSSRQASKKKYDPKVRAGVREIEGSEKRNLSFSERIVKQKEYLKLPFLPITTIGSFPQTKELRQARAHWQQGNMPAEMYTTFIKEEIAQCIRFQESVGLDVLVYGEFERDDMVEYFAERMQGFALTSQGWIQSYGTTCVKPPIIYGDVARTSPMTIEWATYAQSLTEKPVKGILTGPLTMAQWSFVRNDQSFRETAIQIALALREEVMDLEAAGISIIQVDEPALRESLPLQQSSWKHHLDWAVKIFKLVTSRVNDKTQIHTHMCYSNLSAIMKAIADLDLDVDVISIEMARSKQNILNDFQKAGCRSDIGPGIYDVRSPRVPSRKEILGVLTYVSQFVPPSRLWVNPDCGLKIRKWEEVKVVLKNMVAAAHDARVVFDSMNPK